MKIFITGAVAPETPGIRGNFTMGGMNKQGWTEHRPELGIMPMSLQEIGTPV
ncbi:unnamed protein product, partial [marine sediment metagenome]